jgi:hypothetical protein
MPTQIYFHTHMAKQTQQTMQDYGNHTHYELPEARQSVWRIRPEGLGRKSSLS